MKESIRSRTLGEAEYILKTKSTVRETAKAFFVSKSTVHKDVTERLSHIDCELFCAVKKVLDFNLSERHLRGGNATRLKYRGQ